jgi:hypothetical protein
MYGVKIMDIDEEIHNQIVNALKGADFPINNKKILFESFFKNINVKGHISGFGITPEEIRGLIEKGDFPFNNAEEIAHVVIKRKNKEGIGE